MAENKKSFVLYADLIHTINHISNEDAGVLFKHILEYVNDKNPDTNNQLIKVLFEPIKQSLKRDLKKYEERAERSRSNGSKGGRPKKPKKPTGLNKNPTEPKKPDSVSDSVSDSVNVNEINIYRKFAHLSLTKEEFDKLEADYTKDQIDDILDAIENYKNNKNYKSLYLTSKKWLKKEYPNGKQKESTVPKRRMIDRLVANMALSIPEQMESLVNNGWTKEEIILVSEGKHTGI